MSTVNKCHVYPLAKQIRLPFPSSNIRTTQCFEWLHDDVWGLYSVPTFDGNKYFLTLVDDF